jgi:AbrB family looped-hinge helix DNA binding protein
MVRIANATLTSQGQVSIPKSIRDRLRLQKGSRIVFLEDGNGNIIIQEAEVPVDFTPEEWRKFLSKTEAEPVTRVKGRKNALRHLDRLVEKK